MLTRFLVSLSTLVVLSLPTTALAFSDVYVFGDSLSDSGAFGHLAGGAFCPSAPYVGCRFSDGPVWVETFAEAMGNSADTAYAPGGGTNYAIGGERSDELQASATAVAGGQIPQFSADVGGVADPNALYVVWAGGNDFLQNDPPGTFPAATAAQNIIDSITELSTLGATDFLVSNFPSIDLYALQFNFALASGLSALSASNPALTITEFDTLGVLGAVTANPAAFGLTNVTDPCLDTTAGTLCSNPEQYLLFDAVHPTAAGHNILANAALGLYPIPEPGTALLLGLGLAGLGATRQRAQA